MPQQANRASPCASSSDPYRGVHARLALLGRCAEWQSLAGIDRLPPRCRAELPRRAQAQRAERRSSAPPGARREECQQAIAGAEGWVRRGHDGSVSRPAPDSARVLGEHVVESAVARAGQTASRGLGAGWSPGSAATPSVGANRRSGSGTAGQLPGAAQPFIAPQANKNWWHEQCRGCRPQALSRYAGWRWGAAPLPERGCKCDPVARRSVLSANASTLGTDLRLPVLRAGTSRARRSGAQPEMRAPSSNSSTARWRAPAAATRWRRPSKQRDLAIDA